MLNIAMLSKWHVHAPDYAKNIQQSDKAKITVVWDEDAQRGAQWAEELGVPFEPSLDALLAREDVDAVVCDTPTTMHTEVLTKAANAGKHIFTEKALATTVEDCQTIIKAMKDNDITFTISYPQIGDPVVQLAKKMIDNGDFGTVSQVRFRRAHSGISDGWLPEYWFVPEDAGGGALMDLGCHGYYIGNYLLGKPTRISALMTILMGSAVDESATASIAYENGALFTAETGFITLGAPDILEVHGDKGILAAWGNDVKFYTHDGETIPSLPARTMPMPIDVFIDACLDGTGTPELYGFGPALALTELLENSYRSEEQNSIISL